MAPGPAKVGAIPKSIQQLSNLDVRNTPTFYVWAVGTRAIALALSTEIEGCAAQCEARMSRQRRGRLAKSIVSRSDARKMMRNIHRAGEEVHSAANHIAKGWLDYLTFTEELRNPDGKGWDYRDASSTAPRASAKG
jgi:hypothetical protein